MSDEVGTLSFHGHDIEVYAIDGKTLFDGEVVAKALGYSDPLKALHDHVAKQYEWLTQGGVWLTLIDEEGLDSLIASSKMPNAGNLEPLIESVVALSKLNAFETRYVVRVPHTRRAWYCYMKEIGEIVPVVCGDDDYIPNGKEYTFTLEELQRYGLLDKWGVDCFQVAEQPEGARKKEGGGE